MERSIAKGLLAGLAAGLAASWIMNQFQMGLSKLLKEEQKPHGAQSIQGRLPTTRCWGRIR
jgi:hypothetical protein